MSLGRSVQRLIDRYPFGFYIDATDGRELDTLKLWRNGDGSYQWQDDAGKWRPVVRVDPLDLLPVSRAGEPVRQIQVVVCPRCHHGKQPGEPCPNPQCRWPGQPPPLRSGER